MRDSSETYEPDGFKYMNYIPKIGDSISAKRKVKSEIYHNMKVSGGNDGLAVRKD